MKNLFSILCLLCLVFSTLACKGISPAQGYQDTANPQPGINQQVSPQEPVLLFGIGMHIEPFGAQPSSRLQADDSPANLNGRAARNGLDYHNPALFERHVADIDEIARVVEKHGGKLTVQAQTPFTEVAIESGETLLADLAGRGHEIGLHFHEDAHLGANPERLPVGTWCAVMKDEIEVLKEASGVSAVRFWSGGNLYPDLFAAAACAGLDINGDWKNPVTQRTPDALASITPWRPAGGADGEDLTSLLAPDPNGKVIFLPDGLYGHEAYRAHKQVLKLAEAAEENDVALFDVLAEGLLISTLAARSNQVNVFHLTLHPGEFDPQALDQFLKETVDPLVASGQVRWATFSDMASAYQAWEKNGGPISSSVRTTAQTGSATPTSGLVLPGSSAWDSLQPDEQDVTYCTTPDGLALKMDIYSPVDRASPGPAILYIHGGAWVSGDKQSGTAGRYLAEFVESGYLVAAVNYRLAPQYPFSAQIEDVKCAIRFLRAQAERYQIDLERIGVIGASAGGHLAALLGTSDDQSGWDVGENLAQSSRVQAVVDLFGPTDLTNLFQQDQGRLARLLFGPSGASGSILATASPLTYVSADDPPFLFIHGEEDDLVPFSQSQVLFDSLKAFEIPAQLVVVKNAGHGLRPVGGRISPNQERLTRLMVDFFDRYLK